MVEYLKLLSSAILGSGAAFAILKLIFERRKEDRDRAEAIKYLALQMAFLFEGSTMICASGASDHRTAVENHGHAGAFLNKIPISPPLPDSDAYRDMTAELLNRVFGFSQRCQMAQLAADFWINTVGDRECYSSAIEENTILMGADALETARAIRSAYSLGERSLTFGTWNIDDFIRSETDKVQKRIAWQVKQERDAL